MKEKGEFLSLTNVNGVWVVEFGEDPEVLKQHANEDTLTSAHKNFPHKKFKTQILRVEEVTEVRSEFIPYPKKGFKNVKQ